MPCVAACVISSLPLALNRIPLCEVTSVRIGTQAYAILDEIVMGGAVFETSSLEALRAFNELQRRAVHLHTRSFARSLAHSHTRSLIHSLTRAFTHSLAHSLTHSHTHSLTHSLTRALTHSLAHSLARSLTHSLTQTRRAHSPRRYQANTKPSPHHCFETIRLQLWPAPCL